jgi:uncharacterized protein
MVRREHLDKIIIGRSAEKNGLEHAFQSNEAEFITVFGRRRVGKTFLIRHFFNTKNCYYFQTTGIYKGTLAQQLTQFAKELGTTFYQGASIQIPTDWMNAFEQLTQAMQTLPKNKKIVLFFDELPWMATRRSGIIQALEYFWNRHWVNNHKIKLIICGSAASWIIKKIIKNRGGLHNRITRKIKLMPFNLHETHLYLNYLKYPCSEQNILKLYMATGGVPFYLKNIKQNYSIDQNINHLFFTPNSLFFDEFDEIFSSLFEHAEQYKAIITVIARHKDGIARSQLEEKSPHIENGGRLTTRLEDLENAGFISRFLPLGNKKRGLFYRLNDEFCYFYLKWIEPIKNQLQYNPTADYWKNNLNTPEYYNWLGYTFENICYKHLMQIKKALHIDAASLASPWRYIPSKGSKEQGAQIDLLFTRPDNAITLCEIKYSDKPFNIDKQYKNILLNKVAVFKMKVEKNKQIFIALIAANGIKKTMYSEEIISNVVNLSDLFHSL